MSDINDIPELPSVPNNTNLPSSESSVTKKYFPMISRSHQGITLHAMFTAKVWLNKQDVHVIWFDAGKLIEVAEEHKESFTDKEIASADNHPITLRLNELDKEALEEIEHIKRWITFIESKKQIGAFIAMYGIAQTYRGQKLPLKRDNKIIALPILIGKLKETNYPKDRPANIKYWESVLAEYKDLHNRRSETNSYR